MYLCQVGVCLFVFFILFFRTTPAACGVSQARGPFGATAAGLHHSCSNINPSRVCSLHHSSGQCRMLNPLRLGIEPATSWFLVRFISAMPRQELPVGFFKDSFSFFPPESTAMSQFIRALAWCPKHTGRRWNQGMGCGVPRRWRMVLGRGEWGGSSPQCEWRGCTGAGASLPRGGPRSPEAGSDLRSREWAAGLERRGASEVLGVNQSATLSPSSPAHSLAPAPRCKLRIPRKKGSTWRKPGAPQGRWHLLLASSQSASWCPPPEVWLGEQGCGSRRMKEWFWEQNVSKLTSPGIRDVLCKNGTGWHPRVGVC